MDRTTERQRSRAYTKDEKAIVDADFQFMNVAGLTKTAANRVGSELRRRKKYWPLVALMAVAWVIVQFLADVECTSQDVTVRGPRVFSWAQRVVPGKGPSVSDVQPRPDIVLFPYGLNSINPIYVTQGAVYDCRFLAALASFVRTDHGRRCIYSMIRQNQDGSYTVAFPAMKDGTVTVPPLTNLELRVYAHAIRPNGTSGGAWLPVIEKAYGQYRSVHQTPAEFLFRLSKHGIFEWRWTAMPELPGYGASYGSKDELAVRLFTGHGAARLPTTSLEMGDFGLGKGYVTQRQIMSWFDRGKVLNSFYQEQREQLQQAQQHSLIVTATTEIAANEAHGLRSSHAYAVIWYDTQRDLIWLRDVYGSGDFISPDTGAVRDGRDDGVFYLTIPEFNRCFSHLNVEDRK